MPKIIHALVSDSISALEIVHSVGGKRKEEQGHNGGRGSRGVGEHVTCQLYSTDGAFPGFNEGEADISITMYIFTPAIRGRGAIQKPWFQSLSSRGSQFI